MPVWNNLELSVFWSQSRLFQTGTGATIWNWIYFGSSYFYFRHSYFCFNQAQAKLVGIEFVLFPAIPILVTTTFVTTWNKSSCDQRRSSWNQNNFNPNQLLWPSGQESANRLPATCPSGYLPIRLLAHPATCPYGYLPIRLLLVLVVLLLWYCYCYC